MAKLDIFIKALQQAGHRITPQRRAICEYLSTTDKHPTPYQVFADISTRYPEISRATVYNTLNTLQSLGAIVEINFGEEHKHYDTNAAAHINLICLRCHQIFDYAGRTPDDVSEISASDWATGALQNKIIMETGFQPIATKVDVLGFCHACQAELTAEIRQQSSVQCRIVQGAEQGENQQ
jgi:Fur family peroxide stress response transcriptional regulator